MQATSFGAAGEPYVDNADSDTHRVKTYKYSEDRPFSLQMPFNKGGKNLESSIRYPTSALPFFFSTYLSSSDNSEDTAKAETGPYSTNHPYIGCYNCIVGQYENLVVGMLKRYTDGDVTSNSHRGCPDKGVKMGSHVFPDVYFSPRASTASDVCNSEMNRVVAWDVDAVFGTMKIDPEGEAADEMVGYRINRSSDKMVKLMHLHTGAPPPNRRQADFKNYRPVRSLIDETLWAVRASAGFPGHFGRH